MQLCRVEPVYAIAFSWIAQTAKAARPIRAKLLTLCPPTRIFSLIQCPRSLHRKQWPYSWTKLLMVIEEASRTASEFSIRRIKLSTPEDAGNHPCEYGCSLHTSPERVIERSLSKSEFRLQYCTPLNSSMWIFLLAAF